MSDRYSAKGWLSFDVDEDEDPNEVLQQIETAFDNGMGSVLGPAVYWGPELDDNGDVVDLERTD